jgi:hypothetical protein
MLFGTLEVSFSAKKNSLPRPAINAACIDGNRYSDDYLFDIIDGLPVRARKLKQPPPDIEGGTATMPKTGWAQIRSNAQKALRVKSAGRTLNGARPNFIRPVTSCNKGIPERSI